MFKDRRALPNLRVAAPVEILPRPAFYLSQFVGEESNGTRLLRNNQERKLQILGWNGTGTTSRRNMKSWKPESLIVW